MENASQALIIAGAILLAILIIALGMFVFNNAREGIMGGANKLNETQIKAQNDLYGQYMNGRRKGGEIKGMISEIEIRVSNSDAPAAYSVAITTDNSANVTGDRKSVERIDSDDKKDDYLKQLSDIRKSLKNNEYYTITETGKDNKSGLINHLTINGAK